jgi:hypothetical protein
LDFNGNEYIVQNLVTNKNEKYHVAHLRPFYFDPLKTNPADIANREYESWEIESIINHQGNPKRLRTLDFLVRWKNCDPMYDRWIPWKELRNNPILHQYLLNNNLKSIIPREHR